MSTVDERDRGDQQLDPDEPSRGSRLVWVVMAAGIAVVVLGLVFAGRFGSDPSITASPLIGSPAPEVVVAAFDGPGTVDLGGYRGDIVVVNFWASWCLGCRQEHAALIAASDQYRDLGVTFVGINYQDQPGPANAFLEDLGRGDDYVYAIDEASRTAFEFGVLGLPETFFIDRDGTVVAKVSGPASYELLSGTLDAILLGESVDSITTGEVENR